MPRDGRRIGWRRREQGLQLQLGQALIANQGYQAPATLRAFERALVLADEIGDVALQLPAMYGQWASLYVGGPGMGDLAQRYAALAETQAESGPRLVGLRMLGLERFHEGRFRESLALVRKSLDAYDPVAHRDLAHRFGQDPRAAARNYEAWNLWHLGFPDQAARASEDNLRWTRQVDHANTTGYAMCCSLPNIWLRRPARVESAAREALRLAEETRWRSGMPGRRSISAGRCRSWARRRASTRSRLACARLARSGPAASSPSHLGLRPTPTRAPAGPTKPGRSIAQAFAALAHGRDLAFAAELYRMRAAPGAAGRCMRARRRRGGSSPCAGDRAAAGGAVLELRAARDLASMLAERGERQQADDLLAPVYGWFTEGFDTPDLKEAKALLDELRAS